MREIPPVILHIHSRRWRAVALNTSEIWPRPIQVVFDITRSLAWDVPDRFFPLSRFFERDNTLLIGDLDLTEGTITFLRELMENSNWGSLIVRTKNIPPDVCEAVLVMIQGRNLQSLRWLEVQLGTIMKGREPPLRVCDYGREQQLSRIFELFAFNIPGPSQRLITPSFRIYNSLAFTLISSGSMKSWRSYDFVVGVYGLHRST